jgi:hypothetical protein
MQSIKTQVRVKTVMTRGQLLRMTNGLLAVLLMAAAPLPAWADPPVAPAQDPVQILADVTLIDAECRDVRVMFGPAIAAGEKLGLRFSDILPTGPLRARFEADYRQRFAGTSHDDLCSAVVQHYAAELPGLFTTP